jgi:hypothetical protein
MARRLHLDVSHHASHGPEANTCNDPANSSLPKDDTLPAELVRVAHQSDFNAGVRLKPDCQNRPRTLHLADKWAQSLTTRGGRGAIQDGATSNYPDHFSEDRVSWSSVDRKRPIHVPIIFELVRGRSRHRNLGPLA